MRTYILAVTGFGFIVVAACSSYGTSVVEVQKARAQVASVSLTLPLSLTAGQTVRATATPKDANGKALTDRTVTWYTSSASVASVSDSGIISAVAPGSAVVSAVSEGVAGQATMAVMPPPPTPIATVSVAVSPSAVVVGQTAIATATLEDSSGNALSGRVVTWESSNTAVATVDATGGVKAVGQGNAMIKASSEGKANSSSLSVSAPAPIPVASISVSPATSTLQVAGTVQLSAVTRDANNNVLTGRVISWSSSSTGIATVSASGLVTAVAAGSASITASSEGQSASAAITVNAPAPIPVASISVSPATSTLQVGGTVQLSAVTRDGNNNVLTGRVISWSSSSAAVATVSASGLVTAVAAGSATITATSEGKSGTSAITVSAPAPVPVASVTVSPATASVQVGGTVQLTAVTRDANGNILTGRAITWSSSTTTVATVSGSGLVNTLIVGSATITATSGNASGTAAMTVSAVPPPVTGGSPEPGAGDAILWQDNFDKATLADLVAPYAKRGAMQLITDGHSGQAIRFPYTAGSWDNLIEKSFPVTTDIYFRYWYRLSPGADPTCGGQGSSGFKWFMPWRPDPLLRYTMGVGNLTGGPAGFENTGLEFSSHDNTSIGTANPEPAPFMQNINKSKTFKTTADGAWHEYTLHVVTTPNGYEQIWIDGVLVLDTSAYNYDHDPTGITLIQFPGTMVQWFAGCDFTVDADDLAIWHK